MSATDTPDLPYPSQHAEVLGARMHYMTHGAGDTVLFLHGQPTWSYLWRNVMPRLEGCGRLIAVDLIGYGLSDKPDLDYGIEDHIRYLDAFIDTLGPDPITLVTHGWGSFLGFHYAHRFPDRIKGLAFMEALLDPVPGYDAFDPATRGFFQTLRASQENAERMMVEDNQFVEGILPAMIRRELSAAEMDAYRMPWADKATRHILCRFPQLLCIGGEPAHVHAMQTAYMTWLEQSDLPKLLLQAEPGLLVPRAAAEGYRARLPNLEVAGIGAGLHYVQEDQPQAIGDAIAAWMQRHALVSGG
jgi:haloalkane dehalogenase